MFTITAHEVRDYAKEIIRPIGENTGAFLLEDGSILRFHSKPVYDNHSSLVYEVYPAYEAEDFMHDYLTHKEQEELQAKGEAIGNYMAQKYPNVI